MAINSYQREIYANQLQHAERRNHKYLYKIGDRYVYPEDIAGKAKGFVADQKQKRKDKKFVKDIPKYREKEAINARKYGGPGSAHQGAMHEHYWDHGGLDYTTPAKGAKSLSEQKVKSRQRKNTSVGKEKDASFQAEQDRRQATIDARNAKQRKGSDFSNLVKAEKETAKRRKAKESFSKYYREMGDKAHGRIYSDKDLTNKEKEIGARAAADFRKIDPKFKEESEVIDKAIIDRDNELLAKKEAKDKSEERNKQRSTGKKQLDKIHHRAKAKSSAERTHIAPDNSTSLGRDSMSYRRGMLDQINSAHRGATRNTQFDNNFMILENRGHLTSDSVERQKHKTRLRKLRQRRGK